HPPPPAAVLASGIDRDGEGRLGQSLAGTIEPSILDAVVGVNSIRVAYRVGRTAGHGIGEIVLSNAIIIEHPFDVFGRLPKDLAAETEILVVPAVGLPAVDDPGLDLERVGRKILDAQPIEEPGRIG